MAWPPPKNAFVNGFMEPNLWLLLHIPLLIVAYVLLLAASLVGIAFIVQERLIKKHQNLALTDRLPSLETMERFISRMIVTAFPLLTAGIVIGGYWALQARGRFWGSDPTEIFSRITWLTYSIYLALRWGRGWRGRKSTYLALAGFGLVMLSLAALMFFSPLHRLRGI